MAYSNYQKKNFRYYQNKRYRSSGFSKNPPPEHSILLNLFRGIGNLILGLFWKKVVGSQERKVIISRWYKVRELLSRGNESNLRFAVIEADKTMDYALKVSGFYGNKFADRLRDAKTKLPKKIYSDIWAAHILRNELVHNFDSKINRFQARDAINKIRNGLKSIKGL